MHLQTLAITINQSLIGKVRLLLTMLHHDPQTIWSGDFFVVDGTGLEQQRRRPLPAAETGRSCWGRILIFQSSAKGLRKNQQMQPVRPRRFPTARNVYQERCRRPFGLGIFLWWTVWDSNRAALRFPVCKFHSIGDVLSLTGVVYSV